MELDQVLVKELVLGLGTVWDQELGTRWALGLGTV